jgi:hypothetical protein
MRTVSPIGPWRTSVISMALSAIGGRTDMPLADRDFRSCPTTDIPAKTYIQPFPEQA